MGPLVVLCVKIGKLLVVILEEIWKPLVVCFEKIGRQLAVMFENIRKPLVLVFGNLGQHVVVSPEKIWKPFGMEGDANWYLDDDVHERYAGGIMATTRDYARFGLFITEQLKGIGTTIIPQDYLEKATSYQIKTPYDWGYGYQWWVAEPANFPDPVFMADGIFGQSIFIDPKRDLVIAINSSWPEPLGARNDEWVGRYVFWRAVQAAIDKENETNS